MLNTVDGCIVQSWWWSLMMILDLHKNIFLFKIMGISWTNTEYLPTCQPLASTSGCTALHIEMVTSTYYNRGRENKILLHMLYCGSSLISKKLTLFQWVKCWQQIYPRGSIKCNLPWMVHGENQYLLSKGYHVTCTALLSTHPLATVLLLVHISV